jgi:septal ring factor EnvC (AmiA/AmiB activator)
MLRSLALRAFGATEEMADAVNVIEADAKEDDQLVKELLVWNSTLEEELQKTKEEVRALSQQLITLTGKQITLQDQRTQTEDRLLALQQSHSKVLADFDHLRKENKLLHLKLELSYRIQAEQRRSLTFPSPSFQNASHS